MAPSLKVIFWSGTTRSKSNATALPNPSHLSHAPAGLLNENILGSISSMVKPLSGQEKLDEKTSFSLLSTSKV